MAEQITLETVVKATPDLYMHDQVDHGVILDRARGKTFDLDYVSMQVWHRIQEPTKVRDLLQLVIPETEKGTEEDQHKLVELMDGLQSRGLIEVVDEGAE